MVIPWASASPPSLHLSFDHRQPGGILATVRHKSKALPRENEVANVEAVFNVLKTLFIIATSFLASIT
jgi:hypothetical protein